MLFYYLIITYNFILSFVRYTWTQICILQVKSYISIFEKKTFICNLIDYFLRHIYSYFTPGAGVDDVILLFNYYLQFYPKLCVVYIDTSMNFTSRKLYYYFWKKDIAVIFTPSISHKLVGLIKKLNDILQQAFKKMREFRKEWEDALFQVVPKVNSWMIKYLDYSLIEMIIRIQPFISIECKIWINSLPIQFKVLIDEQMFPLVWDY